MIGGGMQQGQGDLPMARTMAEQDSARQVLGRSLVGLGQELLSPKPDPVTMMQLRNIITKIGSVFGKATAQNRASMGGSTLQTGVNQPADRPAPMPGMNR